MSDIRVLEIDYETPPELGDVNYFNGSLWVPLDTLDLNTATGGGSANAQTLTTQTGKATYTLNERWTFIPTADNTGATTLNRDEKGTKDLFFQGYACIGGELVTGVPATVVFDGTQYQLLNHGGGFKTYTPAGSGAFPATLAGVSLARYQRFGKVLKLWIEVNAVTTSTTNTLGVSLPIAATSTSGSYGGSFFEASVASGGGWVIFASSTVVSLKKYNDANFTSGNSSVARFQMDYFVG